MFGDRFINFATFARKTYAKFRPPLENIRKSINMVGQEPAQNHRKMHVFGINMWFAPRGSVWSFEGGILLSFSLGLAVRTFLE